MAADLFNKLESQFGLPAGLLDSVWSAESARGKNMRSPAGAMGHFQFMPATAKEYGLSDPSDLVQSATAAARKFSDLKKAYKGDTPKMLAAYNWGNGNLDRNGLDRAPAETRNYIKKVSASMGTTTTGRDLSSELFGDSPPKPQKSAASQAAGRDLSAELFAPEPGMLSSIGQGVGNVVAGAVRGAGSIGATLLAPYDMVKDAINGKGLTLDANRQRRAGIDGGLQELGAQPDSWMYKGGKLVGEIAGTAGAGGVLGNALSKLAPGAVANAPRVAQLVEALKSGGFTLGGQAATTLGGRAADVGIRAAGGAISGGVSAGMVNPDDAGTGALVGGALPAAVQGIGAAAGAAGRGIRAMRQPQEIKLANRLAELTGMKPDELLSALNQQGPNMLPGYQKTVPQILQDPTISQLQRTLKTSGANALGDAERVQQGQMRAALERVAPIDLSVQDAAARAGGAIQSYAVPARAGAAQEVRQAFDAVDMLDESALHLPITEMEKASARYLGPGTFGTGSKAATAINTAKQVGTQELPAIGAIPQSAGKTQSLEQAVRAQGGILPGKYLNKEITELGRKQSKTTGLVSKVGRDVEAMANTMHERGFLPDNDPATLLDMLRNGGGRRVFADDHMEAGFQRMADHAAGDLPGAETISKAVPFGTVQNLRSSIGEAAEQAAAKGANKEAAALREMVAEIDSRVNRAAGGNVGEGEFFPKDMADRYRAALKLHADKMAKFETGPQSGLFRKGGDGQASIQGAEIPGKFYSGRRSQVDDVKSLKRLVGDSPALIGDMKRYAVTEGASTANASDELTSKYAKWLKTRSGANRELFTPSENATLGEVGKAVERSLRAENLGRVSGSDTAQKLAALNDLGLLDNKMVNILATRIPFVGPFTAPVLTGLRDTAGKTRNNALAKLLANPDDLAKALKPGTPQGNALLQYMNRAGAAGSNVLPVLSAQ